MTKELLLENSAVIPHLRRNEEVLKLLTAADNLYLPIVVLGELLHGAYRLPFPAKQMEKIQTFLRAVTVLGIGTATADQFGQISAYLSTGGNNIDPKFIQKERGPMTTTDRYRVRVGKRWTTITVDKLISALLAINLGSVPETEEAHDVVREYFQEKLDEGKDPGRVLVSHWLKEQSFFDLVDTTVSKKYWEWFLKAK